jgi:hypothetical protein
LLYVSPRLREFTTYAINPIEIAVPAQKLDEADRAELAVYFREKIIESLRSHQYAIVEEDAPGVARIRLALTDVVNSTWWQKVHPGIRMTGAGTGGASVEGEIIESKTGEQLAAWVATNNANRFDLTAFSTVADIKNIIDRWAAEAATRLDALRAAPPTAGSTEGDGRANERQ